MARSKKANIEKLTAIFRALSNPTRLKIFLYLASYRQREVLNNEQSGITVGLIVKNMGIVPSTASHHIKQLHVAALIHMKRCGKKIYCWVNSENLEFLKKFFAEMHQKLITN